MGYIKSALLVECMGYGSIGGLYGHSSIGGLYGP